MSKITIRVDDRLIHGQTVVAWCPTLGIQEIIAVDNVSALNPMLKSIMSMGVPKQYKTHIVTVEEAQTILDQETSNRRLVIAKFPNLLKMFEKYVDQVDTIILGNLAKREDTIHSLSGATGIFYLSDQDVKDIDDLVALGFKVEFQQLPNTAKVDWATFKKSI